jgi:GDPmannose 4,6-dehydratase
VIATGAMHSVKDFVEMAFLAAGIENWQEFVKTDAKYVRPAEVDLLIGKPEKANTLLGWSSKTQVNELATLMVQADLQRHGL